MKDFEEIMEEVKMYDGVSVLRDDVPANTDVQFGDADIDEYGVTLWSDSKTRNDMLKCIALMAFTGACAYFKLMHAALYIPLEIVGLCYTCYKYGVFRGRTEE